MKKIFIFMLLMLGMISVVNADLTTNNLAYWSFDNTLNDSTGNGNNLINNGATYTSSGKLNGNYDYDGTNDYMQIPNNILSTPNTWSISLWANADSFTSSDVFFVLKNDYNIGLRYDLASSKVTLDTYTTTTTLSKSTTTFSTGTWLHIVATYDGTNQRLYINGNLEDTDSAGTPSAASIDSRIGSHRAGTNWFNGRLDEVGLWSKTLNTTEIAELYNGGVGYNFYDISSTPTINHNISEFYNTENISISLNTTTNTNMSYVLDGGSETSIANNTNATSLNLNSLSETLHNITLISTDINGQVNVTTNFTIDLTAPTISIIGNITQDTFFVNFSTIFNVTDNLSGIDTCTLNITYLSANETDSDFFINCTDTQTFTRAGLYNGFLEAFDNAGNKVEGSINGTINPVINISFKDSLGADISGYDLTITHPNAEVDIFTNVSNPRLLSPINDGVLDLGNHTLSFSKFGFLTQDFIVLVNTTNAGTSINFSVSDARILLYIRDQETGTLITGTEFTVDFIASVGTNTTTTTGLVNITNLFFIDETYLAVVSNEDYQTETLSFDFTNREVITLTAYMIETNNTNLGIVFIKPVDNFGNAIIGANVKALQWDTSTSSYIEVSSALTGSDGLGTLNIILDDKVYIFTASFEGNSGTTTSEIIDSTENGKTITIKITGLGQEYQYLLENVITSVTESFDEDTNISTLTFNYESSIGAIDICLNSYIVLRGSETALTENCITDTSGSYILAFNINNSYLTVLKGEIEIDGVKYTIKSFEHQPKGSFDEVMGTLGLNIIIVPLLFILAISLALIIENVYIGTFLIMIMGGLSLTLAPTVLTKGIVAFLFFMGWITINYGVKSK